MLYPPRLRLQLQMNTTSNIGKESQNIYLPCGHYFTFVYGSFYHRWLLQWDTHNINTTGLPIMKPHKTIDSRYVRHDGENSGVSISEDEVLYCWWGQILFSNQDGHVDIIKLGEPLENMIIDSLTIYRNMPYPLYRLLCFPTLLTLLNKAIIYILFF